MSCPVDLTSEDIYELIVAEGEPGFPGAEPVCKQPVNGKYAIWYYRREDIPLSVIAEFPYSAIPKCYGLLDTTSLEVSGIIKMQNLPTLSLTGQGVFIAVIDTGIAYTDKAFRNQDGSTRIAAMWDQTARQSSNAQLETDTENGSYAGSVRIPSYGTVYTRNDINAALAGENPLEIVPERDENGHGTLLASIAGGSASLSEEFTGAAPQSELIVVKLRPAKQYLRDFFFIPEQSEAYAENDIMAGIDFAHKLALEQNRPLVIMLGLGTNNGSHAGTGPLCEYLDSLSVLRHRAVVTAIGNEANMRHHFFGRAESVLSPQKTEINVERDMNGFYVELWVSAPERVSVSVQSPTGEVASRVRAITGTNQKMDFLFEGTRLTVNYRDIGRSRRDQLIFMRFANAVKGIWTINVYPEYAITGNYHMWLPMQGMLESAVYFLNSNPDTTLVSPSDAEIPMTVGGYNAVGGELYLDSGRGFTSDDRVKPDFLAPAVEVTGKGLRDNYVTATGTSAAAAITAGACAQILEWAVVQENAIGINSVDIQNMLIRSAVRSPGQNYPSREYGYGKMDVYRSFELLRSLNDISVSSPIA